MKRGVFVGKLSWLATLCSTQSVYLRSVHEAFALYAARGYDTKLLRKWTEQHIEERWEKQLGMADIPEPDGQSDVLVLKSIYNTTWNLFSAKELGDTVLGSWQTLIEEFAPGNYDPRSTAVKPAFPLNLWKDCGVLGQVDHVMPAALTTDGVVMGQPIGNVPDICKVANP